MTITVDPLAYGGGDNPDRRQYLDPRAAVISQYANSPVMLALVDALTLAVDNQGQIDDFYDWVWNIDTAQGIGLDIWGRIVGVKRALYVVADQALGFSDASDALSFADGVFFADGSLTPNYNLTDEAYRALILAKAAANITNSSIPAINAILRALFPSHGNVYVRDNRDMTMVYVFGAPLSKVDYAIVTQSGALPKPVGVSVTTETP